MEEDDITPYPRTPPSRSFDQLVATGIALNPGLYDACSKDAPRYDSYSYVEGKNLPRWSDEDMFYNWLTAAAIPRELAEMLYMHAPEVSFMLGPGHIWGVEDIIKRNALESEIRQAGFFALASRPDGDFVVIRLHGSGSGEVGCLSHGTIWGKRPEEIREMFKSVASSIGAYFGALDCEG